mmetsp:Transcript_3968/g.11898  ORF Transcript_3968/g.11898 Transcript_3968/m.11898 type:complete len:700 (+) Transcript_3968:207-2306(+)
MAEDKSWGGGTPAEAPEYVFHRMKAWDAAVERRQTDPSSETSGTEIQIELPDGSRRSGVKGQTTPMQIAESISEGLARNALVALVNDAMWDLERPLEGDCSLKICDFEADEGKTVLWHSTAHMLGEAMEYKYKGELCIGPPLEDGFYYDIYLGEAKTVHEDDFKDLENRVDKIAKSKRKFQRMELTKQEAKEMFGYNRFKMELIERMEEGTTITAYRDGPFIDLCRGPHIPNSARVKALMVRKASSAYWLGNAENPSLQRVYGIAFPDKAKLKDYKTLLQEAAKRDHRLVGRNQELFFFNPLSPGCGFFLPHGARIYNTLINFIREEYWNRGYEEVISPNVFDFQLWETSGHAQNYRDNMFSFEVEKRDFGLKPMNCPGHCVIYGSRSRSYRELPLRLAEFGVLHRNELSGTLGGLIRVRRFVQDDAHIFCMPEQVKDEIVAYLEFMKHVYDIFGFQFELELSTRPEDYLGDANLWNVAEAELTEALEKFTGKPCGEGWQLNPGDGAFYGPKIDIKVFDALKRKHQCATVQLDFQQPLRFDLTYRGSGSQQTTTQQDGRAEAEGGDIQRPVIIHRAIYGSIERFLAIITEHFGGKWPFWLSPRQVCIVPVSEPYIDYGRQVQNKIRARKFFVDVDSSDKTLAKKVREAQLAQYNFILVVGEKEKAEGSVNVRTRENLVRGSKQVDEFLEEIDGLRRNFQ